jgi:hypothetical protein
MALVIRGKTTCSVCGLVLKSSHDVVGFPPVLPPDHLLWRFSDSAMHRSCYEQWEHHDYFEAVVRKRSQLWDDRPANLKLTADEINALEPEKRVQFWGAVDAWSAKAVEDMRDFLSSLGLP